MKTMAVLGTNISDDFVIVEFRLVKKPNALSFKCLSSRKLHTERLVLSLLETVIYDFNCKRLYR